MATKQTIPTESAVSSLQGLIDSRNEELLRVRRVCGSVGVSKTTWYKWVQEGKAPKGIRLSPGITVWRKSDIESFIAQLVQEGGVQ